MTRGHSAKEEREQSQQKMQMSWDRGPLWAVWALRLEVQKVRRTPPLASPTAVRTENWALGEGESCFSQGKEEMEVKEQPGHLSKSGSFLSGKKKKKISLEWQHTGILKI